MSGTAVKTSSDTLFHVFDRAFDETTVAELRAIVDETLRDRPPLGPGERDERWWNDLRRMLSLKQVARVDRVLSLFAGSPLLGWCRERLGEDLVFVLDFCHFRYFDPVRRPVPTYWHFDASILGPEVPLINFWIPLVDVGETAPGVTVVPVPRRPASLWNRFVEVCDANENALNMRIHGVMPFDGLDVPALVAAEPDLAPVTPRLKAGGAIAFNHLHLHSTQQITPQMGPRASLEIRLIAAADAAAHGIVDTYSTAVAPKPPPKIRTSLFG